MKLARVVTRWAVTVACLLAATSCRAPLGPSVPLLEPFTLAPDAAAVVAGAGFTVVFVPVAEDSRCPINALCVRAGNVVIEIEVREPSATFDYLLTSATLAAPRFSMTRLRFSSSVQPPKLSGMTIPPGDYRATFKVSWP